MSYNHLVSSYGYWAVFGLVMAESLGIPLPGESALVAAGTYAGATHKLSIWLVFAVASGAAVLGNLAGYVIGRTGGFALALRYGRRIRLDEHKLKIGKYVLDRQGGKVVFFGRFVSVLRAYISFIAGTVHMEWHKFMLAASAGALAWSALYCALSYEAGSTLERLSGSVDWALGGAAVAAIAVAALVLHRRLRGLGARAEAEYPGPLH